MAGDEASGAGAAGFEPSKASSVSMRITRKISMKSASEVLRAKIFAGLPKRAAESLREEIEMLGPVRLKDVEAAQDVVIQSVRRLVVEERAAIAPGRGEVGGACARDPVHAEV